MKKYTSLLIILLASAQITFSQSQAIRANHLLLKADSLFLSGEYTISAPLYKKADSLYNLQEKRKTFYCQCKIAECMTRQGKLEASQKLAENILTLCPDEYKEEKGEIYNTLGLIYLEQGKQKPAESYFEKALTCFPSTSLQKAQCYNNMGLLHWIQGNQEKSEEHMYQALEIRKEMVGEYSAATAASYNNLGLIMSSTNPEKALEYYNLALSIDKKVFGLKHPSIAVALNNIGIIQRSMGDITSSLETFNKSLTIWTSIFNADHPNVAFVYSNMGEAYALSEQLETALDYQQKALVIYQKNFGNKHPEIASTYNSIGNVYDRMKKFDKAIESFHKAINANIQGADNEDIYSNPVLQNYYNPDVLAVSLQLKAKALENYHYTKTLKLQHLESSFNTLIKCDSLIEKLRQVRTGSKDKIELGKLSSEIYEDAISTAISLSEVTLKKKYYLEKAFYFSEKNKGAVLLGSIADAQAKSFAGIPDSILDNEQSLTNEISFYEQKLAQGPSAEDEKIFRNKLFILKNNYSKLIKDLEVRYPKYYDLKYSPTSVTVEQIQKSIGNGLLLSYFIAENRKRLYIFYISGNSFKVINRSLDEKFNKDIAIFRNSIKLNSKEAYTKTAYQLHQLLIPSIPNNIKDIVIIPDGRLGTIPFEALVTSKVKDQNQAFTSLPYLIKKFSVSYHYSSLLFYNTNEELKKKTISSPSMLLCAPVNFDKETGLSSLPGTAIEVEKINKLCTEKGFTAKTLSENEASEENIKAADLSKYTYLHLATHGVVNEDKPELSQIFLTPSTLKGYFKEDGNLFAGEIYNLKLNANLTVLSACQTGLGKIKKGEGVIGLTRALLYAGSDNVMVSLWTVSDASTAEMMINFYQLSLTGTHNPSALRSSKLELIKKEEFAAPYFWAPFIYVGN